jgi:hypothetical protein
MLRLSNKKPFYRAHTAAQLLLNTILAPRECKVSDFVVVNMQQVGERAGGPWRAGPQMPASGPVKDWQIL